MVYYIKTTLIEQTAVTNKFFVKFAMLAIKTDFHRLLNVTKRSISDKKVLCILFYIVF